MAMTVSSPVPGGQLSGTGATTEAMLAAGRPPGITPRE
jgi:hypothetical protein